MATTISKLFVSKANFAKMWKENIVPFINGAISSAQSALKFKTINGQEIMGTGDINIDLSLYKVVTALPTEGIDDKKIYLVKNAAGKDNDVYTEYIYVTADKKWEKLGEYKSTVDLTDYAKTADVNTELDKKADKSDTYTKAEVDKKVSDSGTFDPTQYMTKAETTAAIAVPQKSIDDHKADKVVHITDAERQAWNAKVSYTKTAATKTALGEVKVGTGLDVAGDGTLSVGAVDASKVTNLKAVATSGSYDDLTGVPTELSADDINEIFAAANA